MTALRQQWQWHFDLPPEKLWAVLSDTARFNEAAKGPSYTLDEIAQPDGSVRRFGHSRFGGMNLAWEEMPYQWVENHSFSQERLFSKGPFRRFGPELKLEPEGEGSLVTYSLEAQPANLLGRLLGGAVVRRTGATIERMAREAIDFLKGQRETVFDYTPPELPTGARRRLEAMVGELEQGPYGHGLAQKLADFVVSAQEIDIGRLRPLALARRWHAQERDVIELCLAAVKIGMLGMRWDLLCPSCRGGKLSATALDQMPTGAHCPSCNIDYDRNFNRNVELVFFPNAAIRNLGVGGFCLSGPMTTPHVVVQQMLAPGESRSLAAELPAGEYRARAISGSDAVDIRFDGGGFPSIVATADGITSGAPADVGTIVLNNRRDTPVTLLIEQRDWVQDALTAHRVSTLQAFRDLFAGTALRPGDQAAIDRVTLMFTDLKGSTELYERLGDARAYSLVREHFAFLGAIVRDHDGAIVKTIGDAVMAAFADSANAMRAALAVLHRIDEFNAQQHDSGIKGDAIVIKLGLHVGPCIIVTLNERLDYFGST
ncbi:MAG: adenylate/guanylate cyclase domain-containing protein, partial [Rhodospirillales bacterium]